MVIPSWPERLDSTAAAAEKKTDMSWCYVSTKMTKELHRQAPNTLLCTQGLPPFSCCMQCLKRSTGFGTLSPLTLIFIYTQPPPVARGSVHHVNEPPHMHKHLRVYAPYILMKTQYTYITSLLRASTCSSLRDATSGCSR